MDTPGLADLKLRSQASEAIATALRSGGWYRLFFVVTLEAGRFKPDDLTTIRLVLQASKDIKDYGLILNKVSKRVARQLEDPNEMNSLMDLVFGDPNIPRTTRVFLNPDDPDLRDEDDMYVPASIELKRFVQSVADCFVRSEEVADLKINEFEELQAEAAEEQQRRFDEKQQELQNMEQEKKGAEAARVAAELEKERLERDRLQLEEQKRQAELERERLER